MPSLQLLSKENDVIGTDKYRLEDSKIPAAFRPTCELTVRQNADQSNNNFTIVSRVPVVVTASDGSITSKDTFVASFKFSSLQNVTKDAERVACLDNLLKVITAAKVQILAGMLPQTALSLA